MIKAFVLLGIIGGVCLAVSADAELSKDRSKYKYGYVISHKEGSTQAHLESRDGNLALGRYYVNLPNGNGQKVTYFADDKGFHTGVTYSSSNGKGSSNTQIAMGAEALAAFGNSETSKVKTITASTFPPYFGKKILKTLANTIGVTPASQPKINVTPAPGGFYLTKEPFDDSNNATERPSYVAGLTSQTFSTYKDFGTKYSEGVPQSKANIETFNPTSENVKNEIRQLHIQSTTPSIKTYSSVPQQVSASSRSPDETKQFSQQTHNVKISSYISDSDLAYSKQRSIEKTNFEEFDAQIISEVQKHAEQIIMKDLRKSQNLNVPRGFSKFSPAPQQLSTVTMQPIVVTDGGEINLNNALSRTAVSDSKKTGKEFLSGSINAVKLAEKTNSDQILGDSGYFRVSLSPSLASSINVSPVPQQLIDVRSTDRNSDSNNSTLCESNLCEKDTNQIFSATTAAVPVNPAKENDHLNSGVSSSGSSQITQTFYPQNKLADERHYVTTIDVQKGISLDIQQMEDGSIQLAENFPFNRVKSYQNVNQYSQATPSPIIQNQISVTPGAFGPNPNVNYISTPQKTFVLGTVTAAPESFDVKQNQNINVLQGFNDVSPSPIQYTPQVQDRIENNRAYENQLVPPAPPVLVGNPSQNQISDDLREVEKNIQDLRQKILANIDAHHEEEQRKQNVVDEERKQYLENIKKVESLKQQNSYNSPVNVQPEQLQTAVSQVSVEQGASNGEFVPQTDYVQASQATSYQTEVKDFNNQVPVVYSGAQQTQTSETYSKPGIDYSQNFQSPTNGVQTSVYSSPRVQNVNIYPESNLHQTVSSLSNTNVQQQIPAYTTTNVQQTVSSYGNTDAQQSQISKSNEINQIASVYTNTNAPQSLAAYSSSAIQNPSPVYTGTTVQQAIPTYTSNSIEQSVPAYSNNDIQQSVPIYTNREIQQTIPVYVDHNLQQRGFPSQKTELKEYVQPVAPVNLQTRYAAAHVAQTEEKPNQIQTLSLYPGQLDTIPVNIVPQATVQETKIPDVEKTLLVNQVVPLDYSRLLQTSFLQTYPVSLQTEAPVAIPAVYPVPQQISQSVSQSVALPLQIPQTYKIFQYSGVPTANKQYHSTLIHKPTNKLRVQPLKPSAPDEETQRETVRNILSQTQLYPTYYIPSSSSYNNRLQLRHIRKNQISNSDQVHSQSLTRRGKSLKNLRIEYGFKPPLRPSVEFSEEVKPSEYGPSVQPQ